MANTQESTTTTEGGEHTTDQSTIDPAIRHEAESQGWVGKDRYRGNPTDWVDADVFVKRGREILPILRKNNERLMEDLNATKEQLKEFREAAEEFKKFQRESYERKAADYETRIAEIKSSRAQAITDGDGQKVNALDDALDEAKDGLKEARAEAAKSVQVETKAPPTEQRVDPSLQSWLDRNDWFGKDRRLTGIANGIGESLRLEEPDLKGEKFLERLDEILSEELPNKFGKKTNGRGSTVESGSGRQSRGSSSAHSYDNLPAEAKKACDRFVSQKLITREEYVKDFDWS